MRMWFCFAIHPPRKPGNREKIGAASARSTAEHLVADVAHRLDQAVGARAELGAQSANVDVDGAGAAFEAGAVAPDFGEELGAGEDLAAVLGEELEELELLMREREAAVAQPGLVTCEI